jgi:glutathione-regulated potassium-efflux system ancillary protein KefC
LGAIVLRFLAGAELDPNAFRAQMEGIDGGGLVGFFGPFLGAALVAHNVLGWAWRPSRLAGVTVSKTSVAVVYAVILELGFNQTTYGKSILAACFINNLGTVLALDLVFPPFTKKTLVLPAISLVSLLILPFLTRWFFERHGAVHPNWRPSAAVSAVLTLAA